MAALRIRYNKTHKPGVLKSTRSVTSSSTDAKYTIYLDTNDCTYTIRNLTSGRNYTGGEGITNLHVLKRHVKSRLEKLGVSFDKEIRDNSSRVVGINCSYKRKNDTTEIGQVEQNNIK